MIHADSGDLDDLIHDLDIGVVRRRMMPEAKRVTERGAFNIKKDWRDRWSGHPHIPHLAKAVTYDVTSKRDEVEAEIGPDKERRQGPLGNIIEHGTVHNAPIPGGAPALAAEEPRYMKALADLGEKVLGDHVGGAGAR